MSPGAPLAAMSASALLEYAMILRGVMLVRSRLWTVDCACNTVRHSMLAAGAVEMWTAALQRVDAEHIVRCTPRIKLGSDPG